MEDIHKRQLRRDLDELSGGSTDPTDQSVLSSQGIRRSNTDGIFSGIRRTNTGSILSGFGVRRASAGSISSGQGVRRTSTGSISADTSTSNGTGSSSPDDKKGTLSTLYFPEIRQREFDIKDELESTCSWLLEHEEYKRWHKSDSGLLLITGNPGAGKSTLVKYAWKRVSESSSKKKVLKMLKKPTAKKPLIASFFFQRRGAPLQRTILGLFLSLLYQILAQSKGLLSDFQSDFEERLRTLSTGEDWREGDLKALQDFFQSRIAEKGYPIRIFIDALDECDKDADTLVDYFHERISSNCKLSVCLSSRHLPSLRPGLTINQICVERNNTPDIETYVNKLGQASDAVESKKALLDKASGNFQWVELMISRNLAPSESSHFMTEGQHTPLEVPPPLADIYRTLLRTAVVEKRSDNQSAGHATRCIMEWVGLAAQPLSLKELRIATTLMAPDPRQQYQEVHRQLKESGENEQEFENFLREASGGLVEVKVRGSKKMVQFIHQTVDDFLTQGGMRFIYELTGFNTPSSDLDLDSDKKFVGQGHLNLSRFCISYATMDDPSETKENDIVCTIDDLSETKENDIISRPFLEYTTSYWLWHAKCAEDADVALVDLPEWFKGPPPNILQRWLNIYGRIHPGECPDKQSTLLHIAVRYSLQSAIERLLSEDDGVDIIDSIGRTPLSWAVEYGHEAAVAKLLDKGAKADVADNNGRTPFWWAVYNKRETITKLLLGSSDISILMSKAAGIMDTIIELLKPDATDKDGRTLLSWASEYGLDEAVIKLLEKGAKVDMADNCGRTPLSWTAARGQDSVAKVLLDKGADKGFADSNGRTPLSWAAAQGQDSIVKLLLDKGANTDDIDNNGRTPFWWAVLNGYGTVAELLLKSSDMNIATPRAAEIVDATVDLLEPDLTDKDGRTFLSWASEHGLVDAVTKLLEKGIKVDAVDGCGRTPLSWAAERGHYNVVNVLLDAGADTGGADSNGRTPFWWAVSKGHGTVAELLLKSNNISVLMSGVTEIIGTTMDLLKPDATDDDGRTFLSWASEYDLDEAVVKSLEKGARVDLADDRGRTPLSWAVERGHDRVTRALLDKGADASNADINGHSPFWWAVSNGHGVVAELLLQNGNIGILMPGPTGVADMSIDLLKPDAADKDGRTLLSWVSEHGLDEAVAKLLEKVTKVDMEDNSGRTSLSWAAASGHENVTRLLLEKGADISSTDNNGHSPFWWAVFSEHKTIAELLLKSSTISVLMSGAEGIVGTAVGLLEPDTTDKDGRTLLSWASEHGLNETVTKLLEKGAKVDMEDNRGRTPLSWASGRGLNQTVTTLLEKGADTTTTDDSGRTPFWWAVLNGYGTVAELLLKNSDISILMPSAAGIMDTAMDLLEPDATDKEGRTALSWASECGLNKIVVKLLGKGAGVTIKDCDGHTPFWWAVSKDHGTVAELLLKHTDINILMSSVAGIMDTTMDLLKPDTTDKGGRTLLSWASEHGLDKAVVKLLEKGARVDIEDSRGRTPLWWAEVCGHERVVKLLLERGAITETQDNEERGAITEAQDDEERGAITEIQDDEETALWWTVSVGILAYLIRYM